MAASGLQQAPLSPQVSPEQHSLPQVAQEAPSGLQQELPRQLRPAQQSAGEPQPPPVLLQPHRLFWQAPEQHSEAEKQPCPATVQQVAPAQASPLQQPLAQLWPGSPQVAWQVSLQLCEQQSE